MGEREKGARKRKRLRHDFFDAVVNVANKQAEMIAKQAAEMRPRILQSLRNSPDGNELADGFVAIIKYFSAIAYWRGYKIAKRHYENQLRSAPAPWPRACASRN